VYIIPVGGVIMGLVDMLVVIIFRVVGKWYIEVGPVQVGVILKWDVPV